MNNRKLKNTRGKLTRQQFQQEIPEAKEISVKGKKIPNPDYPGTRRVVHAIVPKHISNLWGAK